MRYRCPNNVFGYCSKEPDFDKDPREVTGEDRTGSPYNYYLVGHCKQDPRTCGNFLTQSQLSEAINAGRNTSQKHKAVGKSKASKRH